MADLENFFYNPARRHGSLDYLTRPTKVKICTSVHLLGSVRLGGGRSSLTAARDCCGAVLFECVPVVH